MKNLSERISKLSPEKRQLLELMRQEKRLQTAQVSIITSRPNPESFPLSFSQQRLWFLNQWHPNSPVYNIPAVIQLRGLLNVEALYQAINNIYQRHEVLRATFSSKDGEPIQTIAPYEPIELRHIDLTVLSKINYEVQVSKLVRDEVKYPFDLSRGPLLRITLIKLEDTEYILLLIMHHIISDGWSMGLFVSELVTLYEAFSNQRFVQLPELPIQFADFAYWQHQWSQGKNLEDQLSYWKEQLANVPPVLNLPTDYPRPTTPTFNGASQTFKISKQLTEKLKLLTSQENVTLFMLLLTAFQLLLSRYTNQDDIVIGSPIANRNRAETEGLIGFFVNTLILRTKINNSLTFRQMLSHVRKTTLEAYAHQDLPFEKLVEELNPERSPSYTPLFQVMFVLQNAPMEELKLTDLTLNLIDVDTETAKFDLLLSVTEEEDVLTGFLEYSTDLFSSATITRMIGYFKTLLENIANNPDQALSTLQLLTNTEKYQLLIEWNNTNRDYPSERLIHELFEDQVQKSPTAPAIIFEEQQFSYGELNKQANQLANYLQAIGVKPDVCVAIFAQRSIEMVLAILGVLKAGGAYIPLDPTYPKDRLNFMLEDSNAQILLTQKELITNLPNCRAQIISLDTDWEMIASQSNDNPISSATIDHLAYVIYTSGSTGKPKGVMNTHGGILNRILWMQEAYHLSENDRVLQKTPFSFDVSVWEFLWPLVTGACLVVARPGGHMDSNYLVDIISHQRITTLHFVPSMLSPFLRERHLQDCKCLKRVICSGEALSVELQNIFYECLDAELYNLYGPTEASIDVTHWVCQHGDNHQNVPIGYPIANIQIYILDSQLNPVPVGVPGELLIGGIGLARGYLNRPRLTAEKFVPNPFSRKPGTRLYKTGDLARYLPDGSIEFLGRIDDQVKIRGYRIELGEVETIIRQYPSVEEAIVINRKDRTGSNQLVAYFVSSAKQMSNSEQLRHFLSEKLPIYMVPTAYVSLDSLPLMPNGKLDRLSLPVPERIHLELKDLSIPNTLEEETLAIIWSQVLDFEPIGVNDNYFALGGDSIRSIQIQSLASERNINFSLQQLFTHQTIRELVQAIRTETLNVTGVTQHQAFSLIPEIDRLRMPDNIEDAYPLSMLQAGMIFDTERTSNHSIYHDVFSFHLRGYFNIGYLQTAIEHVISQHPVLRTSFDLTNYSQPLQLVHSSISVPLKVEDLRSLSYAQQEVSINFWLENEKDQGFEWDEPPLLRFHIHQRSDETFQFSLSCHNTILDGWSVASMLAQLFKIYVTLLNGGKCVYQPPLRSTVRDFIALERMAQESEKCRQYWSKILNTSIVTRLPRPIISSGIATSTSKRSLYVLDVPISDELSIKLKSLARQIAVPLKSVLLAAHLKVIDLLNGFQSEIVTGLVSNGRPESRDSEQILGLFLNVLPFYLKLTNGTWIDLIKQVFDAERELLPFRYYPISQLIIEREGQPLFEIVFNFIHFHIYQGLENLPDLHVLGTKVFDDGNHNLWTEFSVDPISSRIHLQLSINRAEIEDEQAEIIGNYYLNTLRAMVFEPFTHHYLHGLLSKQEYQYLLKDWNNTREAFPTEHDIVQLFEVQVDRTPDAIAIICEEEQLTYKDLNKRANKLARELVKVGVSSEVPVALLAERDIDFITAILAIFKARGVYLPLYPSYPSKRLSQILEQCQVSVVLTIHKFLPLLSEATDILRNKSAKNPQLLLLQILLQSEQSNENLGLYSSPNHLAYIINTSGSTGTPKSAMVEHRGMLNHFRSLISKLNLMGSDRVAQTASQGFVISVWQFLAVLLVGGRVCIFKDEDIYDSIQLIEQIKRQGITILEIVPSQLRFILDEVIQEGQETTHFSKLRYVIVCGEALPIMLCRRWFQFFPQIPMVNAYGSVECSDDVTLHFMTEAPPVGFIHVPIGRPFYNMRVYILNNNLSPVPVGVIGYIYIGGIGVGRGYLNDPKRTSEVFIPDPFSSEPGARLYNTGDLGRYSSDGNIEFIGRKDYQVKIRGIRIELGEIESLLREHSAVREAIVSVRVNEHQPDDRRLIAYVVPNKENSPDINELRKHLRQYLPDHFLPSNFIFLDTLPLSTNGKVDRDALPLPQEINSDQESLPYVAPRSLIEELLANQWAEVLRVENVGRNANFFELGGHSLLATQLISRIRKTFQIDLSLQSIFQTSDLAELAELVETALANRLEREYKTPPLKAISRNSSKGYQLSYAQERLWFLNQFEPHSPFYNLHIAIRIVGPLNVNALEQSIKKIVERHEILRTTFSILNGQPVQIIHTYLDPEISKGSLSSFPEEQQEAEILKIASKEIKKIFNLTTGPLLRVKLIQTFENEHIILLVMHHIISDAWSMELLVRELATVYQAFSQDRRILLEELPIQYVDFAHWQRGWLKDKVEESQLSYWKQKLASAPPLLELPYDRDRPDIQTYRGTYYSKFLTKELLESVKTLSRLENSTLFMSLVAAFNVILHFHSGCEDILIGTDIANRNNSETERVIGFFVNQLVLRTDLSGNPTFQELLKRVRDVTLEAYAHQDLPFNKLVEALNPKRSLRYSPLFQIKIVLQNVPDYKANLPDLDMEYVPLDRGTTQLDLNLRVVETQDGLILSPEYSTDLFDETTIIQLLINLEMVLQKVVINPNIKLNELVEVLIGLNKQHQLAVEREIQEFSLQKLKSTKRRKTD